MDAESKAKIVRLNKRIALLRKDIVREEALIRLAQSSIKDTWSMPMSQASSVIAIASKQAKDSKKAIGVLVDEIEKIEKIKQSLQEDQ